jgi:hypothetical protein
MKFGVEVCSKIEILFTLYEYKRVVAFHYLDKRCKIIYSHLQFQNLYSSSNIITVTETRRVRLVGHVARMKTMTIAEIIFV